MAGPSRNKSAIRTGQPTSRDIELPPQYKPRNPRTQVSVACQSCRKQRSKCSGSSPCSRCISEKQECIFEGRKNVHQRNQDLRSRERALTKVFNILRNLNGASSIIAIQQLAQQNPDIQSFTDTVVELDEETIFDSHGEASSGKSPKDVSQGVTHEGPQDEDDSLNEGLGPTLESSSESHHALTSSSSSGNSSRSLSETCESDVTSTRKGHASDHRSSEFVKNYANMVTMMNDSGTSFGNLPLSSAIRANGYPQAVQNQQVLNFQFPAHSILPLHLAEDELLGKVYTSFRDAALHMMSSGTPAPQVLGLPDFVKLDLFFRPRTSRDAYNVDNFACEILKTRPDDQSIFVKLACVPLVARLMKWMLMPTSENYANLPDLIRPLPSQRFIPHSPALDLAPHPAIRDAQMRAYNSDWLSPENQTKAAPSVNWPHTLAEAIATDPFTGSTRLTPEFESHALDPENWTFKEEVLEVYPDLDKLGARIKSLKISDER